MNGERWGNLTRARHAYDAGGARLDSGPLEAFFEVAARCNLHCQMCAINYDSRYQPRSGRPPLLTPDLFERLAPIFPSLVRAYLFGLGEPLLNRHLVEYVRRLSAAGAEVWFNTNATLIDDEKAEELALAGADRITVSIDGATAETYERIRVGATFEAVVRGIRALAAAQRRHGRPIVNLSFVAMASNVAELPRLVDLCADLGAEGIHVEPLYSQRQDDLEEHYRRENLGVLAGGDVAGLFDRSLERAEERGVKIASRFLSDRDDFDYLGQVQRQRLDWKCSEPWSSIWVTSAGEVRTCCLNETSFGNLFERSFEEIWNGPEFVAFRRQHAAREIAAGCGNCYRNGRVRHSAFFAPVRAVTYRPIERREVAGPPAVTLNTPGLGETVTDPIVVAGRIVADDDGEWEVMLDDQPLGVVRADRRLRPDAGFVLHGPVPFTSEGAHLVWMRRRDDPEGPGHGYREVHLWRPAAAGGAVRSTGRLALRHFAPRRVRRVRAEIDGRRWDRFAVLRPDDYPDTSCQLLFDLSTLPPGRHELSLRVNWRRVAPLTVERLPA